MDTVLLEWLQEGPEIKFNCWLISRDWKFGKIEHFLGIDLLYSIRESRLLSRIEMEKRSPYFTWHLPFLGYYHFTNLSSLNSDIFTPSSRQCLVFMLHTIQQYTVHPLWNNYAIQSLHFRVLLSRLTSAIQQAVWEISRQPFLATTGLTRAESTKQ